MCLSRELKRAMGLREVWIRSQQGRLMKSLEIGLFRLVLLAMKRMWLSWMYHWVEEVVLQ